MSGPWLDKSLSFVRQLVRQSPNHVSAADARNHSGVLKSGVPPVGVFVWYDSPPYGNVALSLGHGSVLGVGWDGWPHVYPHDHAGLGTYVGWSVDLGGLPALPKPPKEE